MLRLPGKVMKAVMLLLVTACASAQMLLPRDSATLKAEWRGLHGPVRSMHIERRSNCVSNPRCPPPVDVEDLSFTPDGWMSEVSLTHEGKRWWHGVCRRDANQVLQ